MNIVEINGRAYSVLYTGKPRRGDLYIANKLYGGTREVLKATRDFRKICASIVKEISQEGEK